MPESHDEDSAAYHEALTAFLDCLSYLPNDATKEQLKILAMQAVLRLRDQEGQEAVDQLFEDARGVVGMYIAQQEKYHAEKGKK